MEAGKGRMGQSGEDDFFPIYLVQCESCFLGDPGFCAILLKSVWNRAIFTLIIYVTYTLRI